MKDKGTWITMGVSLATGLALLGFTVFLYMTRWKHG